jgi:hypothetical protein
MDVVPFIAATIATLLGLVALVAGRDSRDGFESSEHHTNR